MRHCFSNNAAISAQYLRNKRAKKVGILDVDFHHGNGTQNIFYSSREILFLSLNSDPMNAFPYYLGHADETGSGAGEGNNMNFPMPLKTTFEVWRKSLQKGLDKIVGFGPNALIFSLSDYKFENDPISFFKLKSRDYYSIGSDIAEVCLLTLFVMEGGYDVEEIVLSVTNTLSGFEGSFLEVLRTTQVLL